MVFNYVFRDISNSLCDFLKIEAKPYLIGEEMDFVLGDLFCFRVISVTPRTPIKLSNNNDKDKIKDEDIKYYNPLYFREV